MADYGLAAKGFQLQQAPPLVHYLWGLLCNKLFKEFSKIEGINENHRVVLAH